MSEWSQPKIVSELSRAFGDIKGLLPEYKDIPKEFKDWNNKSKWNEIQSLWFFKGLPSTTVFKPKEGINTNQALQHLATIQGSFLPQHEHKMAAVAYLMSLWFDDIVLPEPESK